MKTFKSTDATLANWPVSIENCLPSHLWKLTLRSDILNLISFLLPRVRNRFVTSYMTIDVRGVSYLVSYNQATDSWPSLSLFDKTEESLLACQPSKLSVCFVCESFQRKFQPFWHPRRRGRGEKTISQKALSNLTLPPLARFCSFFFSWLFFFLFVSLQLLLLLLPHGRFSVYPSVSQSVSQLFYSTTGHTHKKRRRENKAIEETPALSLVPASLPVC